MDINQLTKTAQAIRRDIIKMTTEVNSGHPGGSLSATDIITVLYFMAMRHDPKNAGWPDRDRFILSKGHAAPALYSALARSGYFPVEQLLTLRKFGSPLQGHPEMGKLPGVEASTGSLGQGLSIASGIALAGKLDNKDYRTYVMIGDGESEEGQIWEAAMSSAYYRLDNLTAFIDYNSIQLDGWIRDIMELEPIVDKWKSFGWHVIDIDGHNFNQIIKAIDEAKATNGKPTVIVARTIKGKGVSFMENNVEFHGMAATRDQMAIALRELGE
ncbi:MAG: transketolase [Nitrospirae bacterium]|nr:transketolase [Nitrospirota bacterium]